MDAAWDLASYNPSSACEVAPFVRLEAEQLEAEIQALQAFTVELVKSPYDPEVWLNRGQSLRLLGYPELALGDVYKARLLVEAAMSSEVTSLGDITLETVSKKTYDLHTTNPAYVRWKSAVETPEKLAEWVTGLLGRLELQIWTELMEGLMAANCCADYLRMAKEAVGKFPGDEVFVSEVVNAESWYLQRQTILEKTVKEGGMTQGQMESTLANGGVYPTAYPWMSDEVRTRSEKCLVGLKRQFKAESTNAMVMKSTIRNVVKEGEEEVEGIDVLGVVATRDVVKGETIISDPTLAAVLNKADGSCPTCWTILETPVTNECCSVAYCTRECATLGLKTYHKRLCSKDTAFLTIPAAAATHTTDFSLDALLMCRVLALSVQERLPGGPLETAFLQRLTSAYDMPSPQLIIFNFEDHIVTPNLILNLLSVDPYSNPLYDTWVIHTIRCRLQNNKHGQSASNGAIGTSVNPLYSMFNHSCRPNVDWRHTKLHQKDEEGEGWSSTTTLFAVSDVREGEELCISYIGYGGFEGVDGNEGILLDRKTRQGMLMGWLGMECGCVRCTEEKAQEEMDGLIDGMGKI